MIRCPGTFTRDLDHSSQALLLPLVGWWRERAREGRDVASAGRRLVCGERRTGFAGWSPARSTTHGSRRR